MLPVMIVQFGLRLKALCADITDELAIARVELGMSFQKGGLFEALVAAFKIADKGFGWPRCSRGHDGGHATVAGRGDALDDGDLLATGGAKDVATTTTGGDDRRPGLPSVD